MSIYRVKIFIMLTILANNSEIQNECNAAKSPCIIISDPIIGKKRTLEKKI